MNIDRKSYQRIVEHTLPWLVLAILLIYTFAKFFGHPYGFRFDPSTGEVLFVFVEQHEPTLMVGDRLLQVGTVRWEDFTSDLRKSFFEGVKPGEIVPIKVERDDQTLTIPWTYPGINPEETKDQLLSEWWLVYFFWLAGTLTILLLRPRDTRWSLLAAFNFLTALWLSTGSGVSAYHILYSALVLRMAVWLCVPVYLHLHWVFPRSLGKLPKPLIRNVYVIASGLAIAEALQLLPYEAYKQGFLLAISGSLVLMAVHAIRQPEARRDIRLLLLAAITAIFPSIFLGVVDTFFPLRIGGYSLLGIGLLSFPLLPLAYFYAAYRRQLGNMEIRVNRFISIYVFTISLGTAVITFIAFSNLQLPATENNLLIGIAVFLIINAAYIWGYPAFQKFVERRWLGVVWPPEQIQETYSARITTSASLSNLLQLLDSEILPSLFVRQFAFLKLESSTPKLLLTKGVTSEQALNGYDFSELMAQSGNYRPIHLSDENISYPWVRLVLPLKIGNNVLGFWLFGRRDPDDIYAQAEIPILQSLANQTAIALSNILQTERLRTIYQEDVERYEEERMRLALELHDSILNQLAVLQMNLDKPSQKFQEAYDGLTQRLREIVSDLRPPMLNYGLEPAIKELADNLMERSKDTIQVVVDLQSDGNRCPEKIELHLFRIVQEACENALRHAQAKNIRISGVLFSQEIDLSLEDDGIGFDGGENLQIDTLIANKHFGLAGIIERTAIIGAEVRLGSKPEEGTSIQIIWRLSQV